MIYTFVLFYLLMIFQGGDLREASVAPFTMIWFLSSMRSLVSLQKLSVLNLAKIVISESFTHLQTRSFEESFPTILAPVCSLVIVLLSVQDGRVSVAELSPTVLALKLIWLILCIRFGISKLSLLTIVNCLLECK